MLIIVVSRKRLRQCFTDVRTASIGSGIMGMMVCITLRPSFRFMTSSASKGNKGATAVRLTYSPPSPDGEASRPCTLTFVNSHLAAFDEMFDRRNADFHDISKRLLFDYDTPVSEMQTRGDTPREHISMALNVFETDAIFWMVSAREARGSEPFQILTRFCHRAVRI